MPASEVIALYRHYAAGCLVMAKNTLDPAHKLALLDIAQAWATLADQVEKSGESNDCPVAETPPACP